MAVNLHSPEGLFDTSHNLFRLYNAYSIPDGHIRSVSPVDYFPSMIFLHLSLGISTFITAPLTRLVYSPITTNLRVPLTSTRHQLTCFLSSTHRGSTLGSLSPPTIARQFLTCPLPTLPCCPFSPPGIPPSHRLVRTTPPSQSFSPLSFQSPCPGA